MVWISNYSSVSIVVSVTTLTTPYGNDSEFAIYPKQNELFTVNYWTRSGDETITIQWASGKRKSFNIGKDACVAVYDDAVGISTAHFVQV
jgi:hypothetical protein